MHFGYDGTEEGFMKNWESFFSIGYEANTAEHRATVDRLLLEEVGQPHYSSQNMSWLYNRLLMHKAGFVTRPGDDNYHLASAIDAQDGVI